MNTLTFRLASVAFVLGVLCIAATWDAPSETDAAAITAQISNDRAAEFAAMNGPK